MSTIKLLNAIADNDFNNQFTYLDLGLSFFNVEFAVSVCPIDYGWKQRPWIAWIKGKDKNFRKELVFVNCNPRNFLGPSDEKLLLFCFPLIQGRFYEFKNFYMSYDCKQQYDGVIGLNRYGLKSFTKDAINKILYGRVKK